MHLLPKQYNPEHKLHTCKLHRQRIETYPCPKCGNHELKVLLLEEGRHEWEARVECQSCNMKAVVNDTGFHMDFTGKIEVNQK